MKFKLSKKWNNIIGFILMIVMFVGLIWFINHVTNPNNECVEYNGTDYNNCIEFYDKPVLQEWCLEPFNSYLGQRCYFEITKKENEGIIA